VGAPRESSSLTISADSDRRARQDWIGNQRRRAEVPARPRADRGVDAPFTAADPRTIIETLGHSQISLTMNTYSHVAPALQKDAATKMDAILS
jgi:integrase